MSLNDDPHPTDETLLTGALAGDARALDALLTRHEGKVLRVLRLLGVPGQDREDVAQEVFLRVFRHLGGFRRGHSFGGWLYRVTVNAAHDYRLRSGRRVREEAPWDEAPSEPASGTAAPDAGDERRVLRARLERGLEALSGRERAVFVLREVEGLETADVARALGITSITVRRHLGRARDRLRRFLQESKEKNGLG